MTPHSYIPRKSSPGLRFCRNTMRKKLKASPEHSSGNRTEFFDRHHWLPSVLLVLLPFAMHVPLWLLGRSSDPIWFVSGLTHGPLPLRWPFSTPTSDLPRKLLAVSLHGTGFTALYRGGTLTRGSGCHSRGNCSRERFSCRLVYCSNFRGGILWQQTQPSKSLLGSRHMPCCANWA